MFALYVLTFCRVVIGLVFVLSGIGKARDIAQFRQIIQTFNLLPRSLYSVAAALFLGGEFAVVALVFIGGPVLIFGFSLAIGLLLLFCCALVSVLAREIHTACNCFGTSTKEISTFDVWRNIGLIICSLAGVAVLIGTKSDRDTLSLFEWGLIGLGSGAFAMIWLQLEEIVQFFVQD